jgi:hypothetical protein
MSLKKFAGVMAILLACGFVCSTATAGNFADGDKELGFNFAYMSLDTDGPSADVIILDSRLGWFLTDNHELGAILSYIDLDIANAGTLGLFYDYNFNTSSNVTPVLGLAAAFVFGDADDAVDFSYKVEGGIRYMPGDNASLNFMAFYQSFMGKDGFSDIDVFGVQAGVSVKF